MRRIVFPIVAFIGLAIACVTPPPTPQPPAQPQGCVAVAVRIGTNDGPPIGGAAITVGSQTAAADANGYHYFWPTAIGPVLIHVSADGYLPADVTYTAPKAAPGSCDIRIPLQHIAPPVVWRFGPEHGAIHACVTAFCDDQGNVWGWTGATMSRLFGRFYDGQNLTEDLRWMQREGVKLARVWPQWGAQTDGSNDHLERRPDFRERLAAFVDLFEREHVRLELTAVASWQTPDRDRPLVQTVFDVAKDRWNVFVEAVNEPWVPAYDVQALMAGVDRHGVPFAYGYQPEPCPGDGCWRVTAKGDYVTAHLPRDWQHYPRNAKDVLEQRLALGVPVVDDEPIGIAEYNRDGTGARTNDLDAHVSHFALARLYAAGATIHSQAGLEGYAPTTHTTIVPERADRPQGTTITHDPTTTTIAHAIGDVWSFIPDAAVSGAYARNGLGDFPISMRSTETYDAQGHGYAALLGGTAYVVVPTINRRDLNGSSDFDPLRDWRTRVVNGWRADAVASKPYILKTVK